MWIDDPPAIPLREKLQTFDLLAAQAVDFCISKLVSERNQLIALARKRHIEGHETHGDGLLYEYDPEQLIAEADEELADAIVYCVRRASMPSVRLSEDS